MAEAASSDFIIEARGLSRDFSGFVAVNNVDLSIRRHSIHALIGPNGAGKTTTFNLLTKFIPPSAGRIAYNGVDITHWKPAAVARQGLVRSFQISAVFAHMSVRDNVRIALQRRLGTSFHFWRSERSLAILDGRADELLEAVGLARYAWLTAAELSYGRKRALELATTLALEPEMLLLDEPTSGLGQEDIAPIVALIRSAAAQRTVLMVEHNLSVVAELSDRVTVLARGEVLAEGTYAEMSADPRVLDAYIGTARLAD